MPKNSKPIVCVLGSYTIHDLDLDRFLRASDIGELVTGGMSSIDTLVASWAKRNAIECVTFLPQFKAYGVKYGMRKRDEDMLSFSDRAVIFWDGVTLELEGSLAFAADLGIETEINIIEDR